MQSRIQFSRQFKDTVPKLHRHGSFVPMRMGQMTRFVKYVTEEGGGNEGNCEQGSSECEYGSPVPYVPYVPFAPFVPCVPFVP